MTEELCKNCGHPELDHHGRWVDGSAIPGNLCYWTENQGYCEDLCTCPGFNVEETELSSFTAACRKAGVA